jgi:hypothetical protein
MDYQAKLIRKREAEKHIQQLTQQHKEKYDGDIRGLRMVRIDANTLVFSRDYALSDEQIRENWLKKHKLYNPKNL